MKSNQRKCTKCGTVRHVALMVRNKGKITSCCRQCENARHREARKAQFGPPLPESLGVFNRLPRRKADEA
jgi:hypothetical protein